MRQDDRIGIGRGRGTDPAFDNEVDAVLAASRVLVGVAARSLAPVEDTVTLTQFRALVIIASRGPLHLAALADAMGVHPSNATRTCDRLVATGLADRRDNPADRRHLLLTLTAAGRDLVDGVMRPPAGGDRADPARCRRGPRAAGHGAHPVRRRRRRTRGRGPVVRRLDHRIPRSTTGPGPVDRSTHREQTGRSPTGR